MRRWKNAHNTPDLYYVFTKGHTEVLLSGSTFLVFCFHLHKKQTICLFKLIVPYSNYRKLELKLKDPVQENQLRQKVSAWGFGHQQCGPN